MTVSPETINEIRSDVQALVRSALCGEDLEVMVEATRGQYTGGGQINIRVAPAEWGKKHYEWKQLLSQVCQSAEAYFAANHPELDLELTSRGTPFLQSPMIVRYNFTMRGAGKVDSYPSEKRMTALLDGFTGLESPYPDLRHKR